METNKQFNAENLNLLQIDVKEFSIQQGQEINLPKNLISPASIQMETNSYSGLNLEENLVVFGLKISAHISPNKDITNKSSFFIDIRFHFNYKHLSNHVEEDENDNYIVDSTIGEILAAITYSTARGIIFEKTAGTSFSGFVLPVIKPSDLLIQ